MGLQLYPEGLHSMKWRRETLFLQRIRPWRWKLKADMTALHTHQGILEKKKKREKILLHLKDNIVTRIIKSIMKSRNG